MEDKEILLQLDQLLENLKINKDDFYRIFDERRAASPTYDKEKYAYLVDEVVPSNVDILPGYIENGSYGQYHSLRDWYLYRNSSSNPLVWENVGKDTFDIINNFSRDDGVEFVNDEEGSLFLFGDGNHRTLTLILNYYIDLLKTPKEEQQFVEDKYHFLARVNYLHPVELENALDKYRKREETRSDISRAIREYRDSISRKTRYILSYDDKTKMYKYELNGKSFTGTCKDMIDFLENSKDYPGLLAYRDNDTYYVALDNKVIKTKNPEVYKNVLSRAKAAANTDKPLYNENVVVVKNYDKNTYDVIVNYPHTTLLKFNDTFIREYTKLGTDVAYTHKSNNTESIDSKMSFFTHFANDRERNAANLFNREYSNLDREELDHVMAIINYEENLMKHIISKVR